MILTVKTDKCSDETFEVVIPLWHIKMMTPVDGKHRLVSVEDLLKENEELLQKIDELEEELDTHSEAELQMIKQQFQLEKKLDITVKALESIKHTIDDFEDDPMNKIEFIAYGNLWSVRDVAKEALKQIKE